MGRNLVLDAGALIGLERGSEVIAVLVAEADKRGDAVVVPASALAQIWRGGSRAAKLVKLLRTFEVDTLDEGRAKEVGVRLGVHDASDVADAHVVCCGIEHEAAVATSDVGDMKRLIDPGDPVTIIPI
ncbi:MAG TPA: hypothetical protein VFI09_12645 [Solirubrobacterales bacterium]|nr:hypothetical protein [Solirubrobacterales bacterium]